MKEAAAILRVVARHRGVASRGDLIKAGISEGKIDRALRDHVIRDQHPGIYVPFGATLTWEKKLLAAVRACGPNALAARRSAAALLRIDGFDPGPIEVIVPATQRVALEGVTVIRGSGLDVDTEGRIVQDVPVTKHPRTMLELTRVCTDAELVRAVESLIRDRRYMLDEIRSYLRERSRGRKRVQALVEIISDLIWRPATDDWWELVAERLMRDHGLRPTRQVYIYDDAGSFVAKVDFAFPEVKVAVDVDGYATHGGPAGERKDHARDARLQAAKWAPVHTTPAQLKRDPEAFLTALQSVLASREPPPIAAPPTLPEPQQLVLGTG